jgi:MoaA/NifB/PqqE/SkfB family radical SAM enzyme
MTTSMSRCPTRVVLNFTHCCALKCEWCYVTFGAERVQRQIVNEVVDRVALLGFHTITFGGGDPFQYSYLGDLAQRAKSSGLNVHIDTHGKSLIASNVNKRLVTDTIDLLGLPLDGPNADVHDSMRDAPGHFDIVINRLRWLKKIGARFKVNTVVTRSNIELLAQLAVLIHELSPWRWSVYQYMPLGPGAEVSATHSVDVLEFQTAVASIGKQLGTLGEQMLEVANNESRRSTYPIVDHEGSVFVHSNERPDILMPVCSIFDVYARDQIDKACGPERLAVRSRYFPVRATLIE